MVLNKTSVLPRLCIRFIAEILELESKQKQAIIKYIETLGAAFQIQDDSKHAYYIPNLPIVISIVSEEYIKERGIGEDIREGKRSLMVIHTMNLNTESSLRLEHILNLKTDVEKLL